MRLLSLAVTSGGPTGGPRLVPRLKGVTESLSGWKGCNNDTGIWERETKSQTENGKKRQTDFVQSVLNM